MSLRRLGALVAVPQASCRLPGAQEQTTGRPMTSLDEWRASARGEGFRQFGGQEEILDRCSMSVIDVLLPPSPPLEGGWRGLGRWR